MTSGKPKRIYTFTDVATSFAPKAARAVARRYGRFLVTYDDALADALTWAYTPAHRMKLDRWLASDPQQTSRIYFSLHSAAQVPAEKMKAEKLGYSIDDLHWYSPQTVVALVPLALDADYDGIEEPDRDRVVDINEFVAKKFTNHSESGDTLAQVMDIRRALSVLPDWVTETFTHFSPTYLHYDDAVQAVVQYLGGQKPNIGSRRVVNNATALARTGTDYDG